MIHPLIYLNSEATECKTFSGLATLRLPLQTHQLGLTSNLDTRLRD
jgi:hypothetical protein